MTAPTLERAAVDPVLTLAEVICRLRAAGAVVPTERESLEAAHAHWLALLDALGVPADGAGLEDVDVLLLRCAAAPRRGDGARSA